jgi:hypothetical protein
MGREGKFVSKTRRASRLQAQGGPDRRVRVLYSEEPCRKSAPGISANVHCFVSLSGSTHGRVHSAGTSGGCIDPQGLTAQDSVGDVRRPNASVRPCCSLMKRRAVLNNSAGNGAARDHGAEGRVVEE